MHKDLIPASSPSFIHGVFAEASSDIVKVEGFLS